MQQRREQNRSSPRVHALHESLDGGESGGGDVLVLVGEGFEEEGEEGTDFGVDDVGFEVGGGALFADDGDGLASTLAGLDLLLVTESLDNRTTPIISNPLVTQRIRCWVRHHSP